MLLDWTSPPGLEGEVTEGLSEEEAPRPPGRGRQRSRIAVLARSLLWPVAIYGVSRLLLMAITGVIAALDHRALLSQLTGFDGEWYVRLAAHGYPTTALHAKSTLGFFPLYPMVMRGVAALLPVSLAVSGVVVSLLGGLVSAVLVQRLATLWWGPATARRAVAVFVLFPGSVVFSMSYSEGLTLPLVLGCLLALASKRWTLAGVLAGLATAVTPVALVLVVVCAVVALRELRQAEGGWRDRAARRSLVAPLLAPAGIAAFAVFLWAWTGTPFATLEAQHYGWHQQGIPLALLGLPVARHLIAHPGIVPDYLANWNVWNGVGGGILFVMSLARLRRVRHELSPGAIALPATVLALTLWSVMTPPNARMLLIAAPAVLVWARERPTSRFAAFLLAEIGAFVLMSALTLSGHMLP